jgi:hypothetical protein
MLPVQLINKEINMNKINLITGIISLVIAIVLFVFGANAYGYEIGRMTVHLYPSAFFLLVAAVQILRAFVPKRS